MDIQLQRSNVNYFAPGLREMARLFERFAARNRLFWGRRHLSHLERKLGLLGWQQADYGADAQPHVESLNEVERAQAQLSHESGAIGVSLHQLEARRVAERETYEAQRADRISARDPLVAPVQEAENALKEKQKTCREIEERLATIERELHADEERYRVLLAKGEPSPSQKEEILALQLRVMAVPREREEWQKRLEAARAEVTPLELELERRRALLAVEADAIRTLEKNFTQSDNALAGEIATCKRDKQKLEKKIEGLEKSKAKPYREIGRILADHGIEPLNQPEALAAVLAQRGRIADEEVRIAASREISSREKPGEVWGSAVLWFTVLFLVVLGAMVAMHLR